MELPAGHPQQPDGPQLSELLPGLGTAVRALARAATRVPEPSDIYYYKNIPEYSQASSGICSQAQSLLAAAATHLTRPTPAATAGPRLAAAAPGAPADDSDDDESALARLTSLLDDTYERLDAALDASAACSSALKLGGWAVPQHQRQPLRAAAAAAARGGSRGSSIAQVAGGGGGRVQRHVASLPRPQDSFPDAPDNSPSSPWTPSRFPHLAAKLAAAAAAAAAGGDGGGGGGSSSGGAAQHPYAAELAQLSYQPWQLQKQAEGLDAAQPGVWLDLDAAPCTLVDTPEGLHAMVESLQGVRQLAIDLEHHSYRSYQGFTCLLQLSTRQQDWVVDTLALRGQLGPALQHILADPAVEKVLHGADHDILWLQRDFGLYIVNLFDTGQAARVLSYPSASLAYLLERHAGFAADKRYQLADWRLRPLPPDMLAYARADTRFLVDVSDLLKEELRALGDRQPPSWALELPPHSGATGALGCVYERSRQLCLQAYSKQACGPTAHLDAALRWNLALPPRNMAVLGALFGWRDRTARALDESVAYVLPKGPLIELARAAPTTAAEVRRLLGKGSGLSGGASLVVSRAEEVAQVIAQGLNGLLQQQQGQVEGPAAAGAPAAEAGTAAAAEAAAAAPAASAAVVKPKELPALVPRKVAAVAVRSAAAGKAEAGSGMRGMFGKAGRTPAQTHQHQQQHVQQAGQEEQQQEHPQAAGPEPPAEQDMQQQQRQQQPSVAPAADGCSNGNGSEGPNRALLPSRKRSSSLGRVLSNKRPAAAAAVGAGGASRPVKSFRLDFLTLPAAEAATPSAAEDAAAADAGAAAAAAGDGGSDGSMQRVGAAEVRAAVNQMLAEEEGEGEQDAEAVEGATAATAAAGGVGQSDAEAEEGATTAAAAAAEGEGDGMRASGCGDLEYVPLSEQHPRSKKRTRGGAAAAAGPGGSKRQQQQQGHAGQQADRSSGKRKGMFDGMGGSDDDGSDSSSDEDAHVVAGLAVLPSYDPHRLAAAAAAGDGDGQQPSTDGRQHSRQHGRGGRDGRGRRGRGSSGGRGGGRGRGGQQQQHEGRSLAAVRRRQGGGGGSGSSNLFEVQDGPFKAARRKGGASGRSRTFKG